MVIYRNDSTSAVSPAVVKAEGYDGEMIDRYSSPIDRRITRKTGLTSGQDSSLCLVLAKKDRFTGLQISRPRMRGPQKLHKKGTTEAINPLINQVGRDLLRLCCFMA